MLNDFDPRYLLSIFLRRFPLFLLTAVLIFAGFAAAAVLLPPTFTSSARILVESQRIPANMVQSTVGSGASERLRVIQQRLMTRENLLEIANDFRVFADRRDLSPSEMVEEMRRSTSFRQVALGGGRGGGMSLLFTVGFSAADPRVASQVASEYVTRILEDNVKLRTDRAANTYQFFEQETQRLGGELTAIESEIVEFKRANRDTLPETLSFRTNQLERVQQRQQLLDRERADLRQERKVLLEMRADPSRLAEEERQLTEPERALLQLQQRRRLRLAILSEEHPEIRGIDTRIEALRRIIEQEQEFRAATAEERASRKITEEMSRIEQQIEVIDTRLAQLDDELTQLERREAELQRTISETPNTQMALTALNRNYSNLQQQYDAARSKLAVSATGEQLELSQQAERFEVIEQASTPETPDKPDRFMILMMGAGGGAGAGIAVIVLLEFLNKAIRRPSDVVATLEMQPLAVIPYIYTDAELRRRSIVKWSLITLLVGGTIAAVTLTHVFYMPLDLLMRKLMEMTQLDTVLQLIRSRLSL
jgi:uncharacterized protein involved in exopolysaccharide biosynthesis